MSSTPSLSYAIRDIGVKLAVKHLKQKVAFAMISRPKCVQVNGNHPGFCRVLHI